MNRVDADSLLQQAFAAVNEAHPDLLELNASERTVTHHLACAVEALVPADVRVDVEYNRHGVVVKKLTLPDRRMLDGPELPRRVFPDLIVHERRSDLLNLIVLEVKKDENDLEFDRAKLRAFKQELGYQHAGHVIFQSRGGGGPWDLRWEDG